MKTINITGKGIELTDSIKNYVNEKCEKLSKYLGDDFEANAVMKIEGNEQIAEIRVNANSEMYKSVTSSKDLYNSIDKDMEILEGQIRKTKTKRDRQNMTETIRFNEKQLDENEEDEEGTIIKTIYYSIKPMTEEDAKLILESDVKNKFLPFINVDTNKVNVIYKLKDGKNFGLLEPEE